MRAKPPPRRMACRSATGCAGSPSRRSPSAEDGPRAAEDGPRAEARHGDELLCALSAVCDRDQAIAALVSVGVPRSPIERDPLLGFSPDEIIVGANGQTLAQAAAAEAGQ
jgi:hypothetical protein